MTLTIQSYINSLSKDRKEPVNRIITVVEDNIPSGYDIIMNYEMPSFVSPHSIYTD